jgi:putative aminopeptidase FrvX
MKKYQKLLGETLEVQSKSGNEKLMKRFVKQYLTSIGLKPKSDNSGNIICHKGDMRKGRPFIVAHLDTVHQVNKNVKSFFNGQFYYAFDMKTMEQVGVGGDDKVGVWAALAAMTQFDNISSAFFVQEEVGCVGSNAVDLKHFKKANWIVELDRRGNVDFITSSMASDEFLKDMEPLAVKYEFVNTNQSTITDVSTLFRRKVGVSGVNIASGYFFPHSDKEVVRFSDAMIALGLTFEMIKQCGTVKYPHLPPVPKKREQTKVKGFTGGASSSDRSTSAAWG